MPDGDWARKPELQNWRALLAGWARDVPREAADTVEARLRERLYGSARSRMTARRMRWLLFWQVWAARLSAVVADQRDALLFEMEQAYVRTRAAWDAAATEQLRAYLDAHADALARNAPWSEATDEVYQRNLLAPLEKARATLLSPDDATPLTFVADASGGGAFCLQPPLEADLPRLAAELRDGWCALDAVSQTDADPREEFEAMRHWLDTRTFVWQHRDVVLQSTVGEGDDAAARSALQLVWPTSIYDLLNAGAHMRSDLLVATKEYSWDDWMRRVLCMHAGRAWLHAASVAH
jgi:hypothetical protein